MIDGSSLFFLGLGFLISHIAFAVCKTPAKWRNARGLRKPNLRVDPNKPSELSEFMTALIMAIVAVGIIGFAGWMDWL